MPLTEVTFMNQLQRMILLTGRVSEQDTRSFSYHLRCCSAPREKQKTVLIVEGVTGWRSEAVAASFQVKAFVEVQEHEVES